MIRRSSRRSVLAAGALVVALGLSSCATFENQRAASVGEQELSRDDLQDFLESQAGQQIMQSAPIDGYVTGDTARGAVTLWVLMAASTQAGIITEADRTAALEAINGSDIAAIYAESPASVQEFTLALTAAQTSFNNGTLTLVDMQNAARDADVSIDSFYGSWDDEAGAVVAMS